MPVRPGKSLLDRQTSRFLRKAPTVQNAAAVIVTVTTAIVLLSAIAMRVFDNKDFPNLWLALWWAVQTVTTVGFGDVVPKTVGGRLIGILVMLEGLAFLAVITALVTSTFVARAQRELRAPNQLDDIAARLDRIETALGRITPIERCDDGATTVGSTQRQPDEEAPL